MGPDPRNGFVLIRNPFSIVASAFRDTPAKDQAERQRNQQVRWSRTIDPLMTPSMLKGPTIFGFLSLYARKMMHDKKSNFPVVRYEDFILAPETSLRRIVGHLGLAWHDGVLRSHEMYKVGKIGHGGIKLWQPIHTKSETKYKKLSDGAKSITYSLTHEVLEAYGYCRDGKNLMLKDIDEGDRP